MSHRKTVTPRFPFNGAFFTFFIGSFVYGFLFGGFLIFGLLTASGCSKGVGTSHSFDGGADDGGSDGGSLVNCGNGVIDTGENCDDGNRMDGDGCDPSCQVEPAWSCQGQPSYCVNLCGNGELDSKEECEGDLLGGNTCETIDGYFTAGVLKCSPGCVFDTTECILPSCGDGVLDFGEECDDGNSSNTDACLNNCRTSYCGDNYVWAGKEECDDGNSSNTDACLLSCKQATCTDGYLWEGHETCDDGNSSNTDACLNTCQPASCGDGYVWAGKEECDDGNSTNTDACLNTCQPASCGDGYVHVGVEDCESGVCCSASCHYSPSYSPCRSAVGECDLTEYCTGNAPTCPADAHVAEGTLCATGICEGGQCVTCYPNTGSYCNGNDQQVDYNCGCGQPEGYGWLDQGNGCYHRFPNFCNTSHVRILLSCGCGEPTTGGWVDMGGGCYHKNTGQSC